MNNPIQALAQMAMNRISSDPNFQRNPQAKAFMDIMQREDEEGFLRFTSGNELTTKS